MPPFPLEYCAAGGQIDPALTEAQNLARCRGVRSITITPTDDGDLYVLELLVGYGPASMVPFAFGLTGAGNPTNVSASLAAGGELTIICRAAGTACPVSWFLLELSQAATIVGSSS